MAEIDRLEINVTANAEQAKKELADLANTVQGMGGISFGGLQSKLKELSKTIETTTKQMNRSLQSAKDNANNCAKKIGTAMGEITQGGGDKAPEATPALEKMQGTMGTLLSVAEKLKGALSKAFSGIKKLGENAKKSAKSLLKLHHTSKKTTSGLAKLAKAFGRIILYRALRSVIKSITDGFKEGVEHIYKYSEAIGGDLAKTLDELYTNLCTLKNAIGAMAEPIISAVAPAISYLIGLVTNLANAVNQLFSALNGSSGWTKATKQARSFGETITDGAKSGSKAMDNLTASIDELNILSENSGGGGSSDALNFEEMYSQEDLSDWAKDIQKALKGGDFKKIGMILGDQLNSIIDSWDAQGLGRKIGEKINNAVDLVHGFFAKTHFDELGKKVSDLLSTSLRSINAVNLGQTIASVFNGAIDFVVGFAESMRFRWASIGENISTAIKETLTNIKAGDLAESASSIVDGVLDSLIKATEMENWELLAKKIEEFISGLDIGGMISRAGTLAGNIVNGIIVSINALVNNPDKWLEIGEGIGQAINNLDLASVLGNMATFISNFATGLLESITKAIETIDFQEIGQAICDFINNIDWKRLFIDLINLVKTVAEKLKEIDWYAVGTAITDAMSAIDWEEIFLAARALISSISEAIRKMIIAAFNESIRDVADYYKEHGYGATAYSAKIEQPEKVIYANGTTFTMKKMASGGFVDSGQLFVAREAGAELVGSMGNKTAVANNDQIVEGISSGVYDAVRSAMGESNSSANFNLYLNGKQLEASTRKTEQRRGASIAVGGIYNYAR